MAETLGRDAARLAGLDISFRTLERWGAEWQRTHSVAALVDRRHLRPKTGPRLPEDIREVIKDCVFDVEERFRGGSRVSLATRHRRFLFETTERGLSLDQVPRIEAYRCMRRDWFGSDGARMKYQRSAEGLPDQMVSIKATRPGEQVMFDTNDFPVKIRDGLFGDPVNAKLTLGADVATRVLPGWVFTMTSDKSVDVSMCIRNVMTPLYMREGWGDTAEWNYPGVPVTAIFGKDTDVRLAGKPFFPIGTATTDHGSVYVSHQIRELTERTGTSFLPARKARGRDKAVVERMFNTIRQLILEHLAGWQGIDPADRGADPEADASLTLEEAEEFMAWFVVHIWHPRALGEFKPHWGPTGDHSPNSLFALSLAQGGWQLELPDPDLYYTLLESQTVTVTRRGVKVKGLWYRDMADPRGLGCLTDPLVAVNDLLDRHGRKVHVRRDPRDCRRVFFEDADRRWHELRWEGLPPEGEFPSFGDVTTKAVLAIARDRSIHPRSQAELLPLFFERWREADKDKTSRRQRSREVAQGLAAAGDLARGTSPVNEPEPAPTGVLVIVPDTHAASVEAVGHASDEGLAAVRAAEQLEPVAPLAAVASRRRSSLVSGGSR